MDGAEVVVERYRVEPGVDVERLRAALAALVDAAGTVVALGPSLLGTLDADAVPPGTFPFVDPQGQVRPLRDDLVVLQSVDAATGAVERHLEATAFRRERTMVPGLPGLPALPGGPDGTAVLVLVRSDGADELRTRFSVAPDHAAADRVLLDELDGLRPAARPTDGAAPTLGADLYVLLAPDLLRSVVAPR